MGVNTLSDPPRFAQTIRVLARDAHRALTGSHSPAALRGLSRRIDVLAAALGDRRGGPLGAWLDNLGREVRSPPPGGPCYPRPMRPPSVE